MPCASTPHARVPARGSCANRQKHQSTTKRAVSTRAAASSAGADDGNTFTLASGARVSKLGIGTMDWGDTERGFNARFREKDLAEAFAYALDHGVNFIDTAEVYGAKSNAYEQTSEHIVGRLNAARDGDKAFVGTKVFTVPWTNVIMGGGLRLSSKALVDALRASVARNEGRPMDLWSIHFPFPTWSQQALTDALREGLDLGLCKSVGVSNYDAAQMTEAYELLRKHDIPLVTNQVKYSLLDRTCEKSGLLRAAKDMNVRVVAYSPLGGGELQSSEDAEIKTLCKLLEFIGAMGHGGRTTTQVALNYLMCKGAIPIAGCSSKRRAKEYCGALGWSLDPADVEMLDEKLDYISFVSEKQKKKKSPI